MKKKYNYFDTSEGRFVGFLIQNICDHVDDTKFQMNIKQFTKLCKKQLSPKDPVYLHQKLFSNMIKCIRSIKHKQLIKVDKTMVYLKGYEDMKGFYEEGLISLDIFEYYDKAWAKNEAAIKQVFIDNKLNICKACKKPYPNAFQKKAKCKKSEDGRHDPAYEFDEDEYQY